MKGLLDSGRTWTKILGGQIVFFLYKLFFLIVKEIIFCHHYLYSKQAHMIIEFKKYDNYKYMKV